MTIEEMLGDGEGNEGGANHGILIYANARAPESDRYYASYGGISGIWGWAYSEIGTGPTVEAAIAALLKNAERDKPTQPKSVPSEQC